MAIRIYEPKVVTHFLSPRTSGAYFDIRTCIYTWYMIIGMDYHIEQVPSVVECVDRGCGNPKQSKRSAFTAILKIAFDINTYGG